MGDERNRELTVFETDSYNSKRETSSDDVYWDDTIVADIYVGGAALNGNDVHAHKNYFADEAKSLLNIF